MLTVEKILVVGKPLIQGMNDTCNICHCDLLSLCIVCEANMSNQTCRIVKGTCGHAYHAHCIKKWLAIRDVCPLDNKLWEHNATDEV